MIDVSICIVTYNSQDFIEACINSIKEKTASVKYEILVIDNNSNDSTISKIEKLSDIKLIKNTSNLGFARAANIISKEAKGKYILFLNPDTILKNNAIEELFQTAENNTDSVLFGGKILNAENKYVYSFGYLPTLKNLILINSQKTNYIKQQKVNINKEQNTEIITGCCFLIRKDIFHLLDGFDEEFFMYYEEIDFCQRLKNNNYKVLYTPKAHIIHYISKSRESMEQTYIYNFYSSYVYCKKHFFGNKNNLLLKFAFVTLLFLNGNKKIIRNESRKTLLTKLLK